MDYRPTYRQVLDFVEESLLRAGRALARVKDSEWESPENSKDYQEFQREMTRFQAFMELAEKLKSV